MLPKDGLGKRGMLVKSMQNIGFKRRRWMVREWSGLIFSLPALWVTWLFFSPSHQPYTHLTKTLPTSDLRAAHCLLSAIIFNTLFPSCGNPYRVLIRCVIWFPSPVLSIHIMYNIWCWSKTKCRGKLCPYTNVYLQRTQSHFLWFIGATRKVME